MAEITDSETGVTYTLYSRTPITDENAAIAAVDAYKATGKQSFDPTIPNSVIVLPPVDVKSPSSIVPHLGAMYDRYAAKVAGYVIR